MDVQNSTDPEGMRVFYYLVQDLKVSSYIPVLCGEREVADERMIDSLDFRFLSHFAAFQDQTREYSTLLFLLLLHFLSSPVFLRRT